MSGFARPFSTPQLEKAKPHPTAFHSTGFIKRGNVSQNIPPPTIQQQHFIPNTPLKHKRQKFDSDVIPHYSPTKYPQILNREYFSNQQNNYNQHLTSASSINDIIVYNDYFKDTFTMLDEIGCGEFAHVYKCNSKLDGWLYAVKKSKNNFNGYRDRMLKLHEVQLSWEVSSLPNCVNLISMFAHPIDVSPGAWEQEGILYMQMNWCEGGNLLSRIQRQQHKFNLHDLVDLLLQLSQGLSDIHSLNIVHLDLKPANILIKKRTYQIADFGIASYLPVVGFFINQSLQPRGSEPEGDRTYMAPEILINRYGKPADIFSLGLIMLEIMTNIILPENGPNWHSLRESRFETIEFTGWPKELCDLVTTRMLEPNPDKRITALEILKADGFLRQSLAVA